MYTPNEPAPKGGVVSTADQTTSSDYEGVSMKHGTARRLTRAATLPFLVFATTSGVAGIEVLAASPAIAQPDQGSPFAPSQGQQPDSSQQPQQGGGSTHEQKPAGPTDGLTGIISGLTGGGGGSNPGSGPAANPGSGTPSSPGNSGGGGLLGQ